MCATAHAVAFVPRLGGLGQKNLHAVVQACHVGMGRVCLDLTSPARPCGDETAGGSTQLVLVRALLGSHWPVADG